MFPLEKTFNSVFSNGNIVWYCIDDGLGNWEIGTGTIGTGTLTRSVFQSSNANALVSFNVGAKRVFCTAPYTYFLPDQTSNSGKVLTTDATTPSWTSSLNGITIGGTTAAAGTFTDLTVNGNTILGDAAVDTVTLNAQTVTLNNSTTISSASTKTITITSAATGAINGFNIGATTAGTGAFTTLSASSTVSGTGFSTYLASPPAIGGTTAAAGAFTTVTSTVVTGTAPFTVASTTNVANLNASSLNGATFAAPGAIGSVTASTGAFTTLSASSTVSGTGFSTYLASPPAIGGTAPAAGAFTDLTSTGNTTIGDAATDTLTINPQTISLANSTAITAASTKTLTLNGGAGSNGIVIDASNKVGIGATSSGYNLYVTGNTQTSGGIFVQTNSAANQSPVVRIQGQRSDTNTSQVFGGTTVLERYSTSAAIGTGQPLGNIIFGGNYTGSTMGYTASISAVASSSWSSTSTASTDLVFYTGSTANALGLANIFYGTERLRIDYAGKVGIGAAAGAGMSLRVGKQITGNTFAYGIVQDPTVQSDVTDTASLNLTLINTQAAAFTLSNIRHYSAGQGTIGAGSAVTNQYGYWADSSLIGATNNYGFFSNIASGTGRYNFYAAGTADNYFAGSIGIGATPIANANLYIAKNITGGVNAFGIAHTATIQSDVTTNAYGNNVSCTTAAASFTLSNLFLNRVTFGGLGAGSAVTNLYGFYAESTLTGATNNFGFYSNIASGTGRYNFYAAGTADNYFAGALGIGATPIAGAWANFGGNLTGSINTRTIRAAQTIQSDVTTSHITYASSMSTAAAAFTLPALEHFYANQSTIGAGSTVNNQYGFFAEATLTGATNNYGFFSNIASGTGRYNFYAAGTAQNVFAGDVLINSTGGLGYTTGSGGAITQITSRTTGVTLNKTNGAITLVSAAGLATYQTFTVTNSTVAATDVIHVCQKSGTDKYIILVTAVAAGSFAITFATTGGVTTEQPVFNFAIIKAVTA